MKCAHEVMLKEEQKMRQRRAEEAELKASFGKRAA